MGNVAGYRQAFADAQDYRRQFEKFDLERTAYEQKKSKDGPPPVPPKRDLRLETLVGAMNGDIQVHIHCYRADEMAVMLDLAREFGFKVAAFHHGAEAYKLADRLAQEGVCGALWADWWGFKMEAFDAVWENIAFVDAPANGCAIVHSDSAEGIQRLNQEAAKAMARGQRAGLDVPPERAIRWLTSNAARALGIADRVGTLEPGKIADVVLWNRDPFSVYALADRVYLDGTLVFEDVESNFLIGAYADIADRVVTKGNWLAAGPYRVPAVRIIARGVLSNTPPATAMRGFGIPETAWPREMNLDEGALALTIDRLEIRLRNLARHGEEFVPGETPADGNWEQTVRRAAEVIGWGKPLPEGRGRGLALGCKSGPTTGISYGTVRFLADGSAILLSGVSDMGQGARTVYAQIVADELGVPMEKITVIMGDTAVVPYTQQTSASRSTVLMGNATLEACRDIQRQLRTAAARLYSADESAIVAERGVVRLPDRELSMAEVLKAALGSLGGEFIGNGVDRKDPTPGHPIKGTAYFYEFNCTAIDVEVDRGTGEVTVLRHITVADTGKSLNPMQVSGQDDGAAIMGLGHSMMEHYIFDEKGRVRNLGAIDYRIPTSKDLPLELISEQIENGDGPGPYGAKGVSEGALLCTAPALGAAVRDATGIAIRDLPLSPERVWRAMRDGK